MRVIMVGAGIGGMTAAIGLRQRCGVTSRSACRAPLPSCSRPAGSAGSAQVESRPICWLGDLALRAMSARVSYGSLQTIAGYEGHLS